MNITSKLTSSDGTSKFLIELDDGQQIESVLLFHKRTITACISSQAGCAMNCSFCATGKMGFVRNLADEEILNQLTLMQSKYDKKITNIVFMGMGEPLHNYENVISAVNQMRKNAWSWEKITISTVGIPNKIKLLGKDTQCKLAVSLHAPNDLLRNQIIPLNKQYNIADILSACNEFPLSKRNPLMIEYILMKDFNDRAEHAVELCRLLSNTKHITINLIPYNPIPSLCYQRPDEKTAFAFKQQLIDAGYKTIVRTTKGLETSAACGMLATKSKNHFFLPGNANGFLLNSTSRM